MSSNNNNTETDIEENLDTPPTNNNDDNTPNTPTVSTVSNGTLGVESIDNDDNVQPPITNNNRQRGLLDTPDDNDEPPILPAQIAAAYDDIDRAIKESLDDINSGDAAPVPVAMMDVSQQQLDDDDEIQPGDTIAPRVIGDSYDVPPAKNPHWNRITTTTRSSSGRYRVGFTAASPSNPQYVPPPPPPTIGNTHDDNENNISPVATNEANNNSDAMNFDNNNTEDGNNTVWGEALARMSTRFEQGIRGPPSISPPPTSTTTNDGTRDIILNGTSAEPEHNFTIVSEAQLVPDMPIYDATPVQDEEPKSWYRRHRKFIYGMVFLVLIIVISVMSALFANNVKASTPTTVETASSATTVTPTISSSPSISPSPTAVIVKRDLEQILYVEHPEILTQAQVNIYQTVMESYTANIGNGMTLPYINTTSKVVKQELVSQVVTTTILLNISFTMQYESYEYGYNVDEYPALFQNYVNDNLDQVTVDMQGVALPVVEAMNVILYNMYNSSVSSTDNTTAKSDHTATTTTTTTTCTDTPNYLDMYGSTCAEYELPGNEAWCGGYGNDGDVGMTPNKNCCVCRAQLIDDTSTVLEDDENTAVPLAKPSLSPTVRLCCYVLFSKFVYHLLC